MKSKKKARSSRDGGGVVAAAAALNDDAWTEILVRLPVKSVTKFKLVCKRWLSLISADHFRRLHTLRRHKPPPSLIVVTFDSLFHYFNPINETAKPIPFRIELPNNPLIKIVSSCNGLLLLRDDDYDDMYVYNPTTKQSRKLSLPHNDKCIDVVQLHLVFDPSVSIHYKIVVIRVDESFRSTDTRTYQTEVFDSECGTWNVSGEPFTNSNELDIELCSALNYGSAVHCSNMIYGKTCEYSKNLYCFDIDRNALLFLPHPTFANQQPLFIYSSILLHVSNGCLYYVALQFGMDAAVWELRGNDEWLLKYHDRVPHIPRLVPSLMRFIMETSTILFRVEVEEKKIMAYSFLDKSCNKLDYVRSHIRFVYYEYFHQFAETLALL
ncbi:hypothetical protein ACS0TY_000801 [Phlomoides rotata]